MTPSTQAVLFAFDDHSVPFTRNLSLTMVTFPVQGSARLYAVYA